MGCCAQDTILVSMQRASNVTCLLPHKLSDSAFGTSHPSDPSVMTGLSNQRQGYTYRTQSWCDSLVGLGLSFQPPAHDYVFS